MESSCAFSSSSSSSSLSEFSVDPRESEGRSAGVGLIVSVLVEIVVLTETTLCFLPFLPPSESSSSVSSPSVEASMSDSSSSSGPEPTTEGDGEAEMSVDTDVLYAAIAFLAASASEVMMVGPGKMCALTIGAQRTIESGPPAYCCCTVSAKSDQRCILGVALRIPRDSLPLELALTPDIPKLPVFKHQELLPLRQLVQPANCLVIEV